MSLKWAFVKLGQISIDCKIFKKNCIFESKEIIMSPPVCVSENYLTYLKKVKTNDLCYSIKIRNGPKFKVIFQ